MKTKLNKIALKYRGSIVLPMSVAEAQNNELAVMFQAEVMRLGYILDERLFEQIQALDVVAITALYSEVIPLLWDLKGADKSWKIFYPQFPKQVLKASEMELFVNAMGHYWSGGKWLPAYPVSRRLPKMEVVKFTVLSQTTEQDCMEVLTDILSSNVSLSVADLTDLEWFVDSYGVAIMDYLPETIPFKETLCTFAGSCLLADVPLKKNVFNTPTDVLRVMTHLSGGDISLASNTKFVSLSRSMRKQLVVALEKCVNVDDIARHGEKWKKAFHGLHIGDYAKLAPRAYSIASTLRNGKLRTFYGKVESAIESGDIDALTNLLGSRPGELARRLDHLMRRFDKHAVDRLIALFADVAKNVDSRVLIQLLGHMNGRSKVTTQRVVMPKGLQSKARILKKNLAPLPKRQVAEVVDILTRCLIEKYASKDSLGKVWIDPALKKCPVPLAQRSASETLRSVARGTRMPLSDKKTLRLFIWWVGHDVDLSCVMYDDKFSKTGQISYTNLREGAINCCHSGDITYAPQGAAEFIDIDMDSASRAGVRYVMMNVLDFTGLTFAGYKECFAGWMTRSRPNENDVFDPKTVEQKVDLRTPTRMAAPVLFDLKSSEAIWLDLQGRVSGKLANNVESNAATIVDLAKSAMMLSEKFSLYELFKLHADARGQLIKNKQDADTVFSFDEGITPFDVVKIGADFV